MGELWRKASETLWARPLLWVPVLLADLLGSGINVGQQALVRLIVVHHAAYHSVMGGTAQQVPVTAAMMAQAASYAIPLSWFSYFLRILLYVVALVITSELVVEMMTRREREVGMVALLRERAGGIFAVGLRLLAVYAVMALVLSAFSEQLLSHGHQAIAFSPWFRTGASLVLTLLLVAVVASSALRLASGGEVSSAGEMQARFLALLLAFVSLALGSFIAQNSRALVRATPGTRLTLEIVGSLLTAVPYVLLFVGYGVLGKEEADGRARAAYEAQATE